MKSRAGSDTRLRSALVALVALLAAPEVAGAATEPVRFRSGDIELAGTLHRPGSSEPVPAVVLVHGSGEEDRGSLKRFATLLAGNGYAALAYDKRGVGQSGGDTDSWRRFSFTDLAADAAAGARFLAGRDDLDASRIGLMGVSQGAWVASLAASEAPEVSFLVLVSASVTTVARDRLFERSARLKMEGFSEEERAEVTAMQLVDQEVTRSGERFDEFERLWRANESKRWFRRVYLSAEPPGVDHEYRRWYRTVLDFDPVPLLAGLGVPALFLFGEPELDRFGPVAESLAAVEQLRRGGANFETEVFSGADHSLRLVNARGKPGKAAPYGEVLIRWLNRLPEPTG